MRKAIVVVLVLAAAAVAAYYVYSHWKAQRPADNVLQLSGNIEAHESVVSFKVQGRLVELPVEEGQWVNAGDVLARLDSDDYRQQVQMDEAGVHTRDAELALAEAGSRSQEIKAAQQSLIDAQADLDLKKADLQRYESLYQKDEVSAQTRDVAATAVTRAQANFERIQQTYAELLEGTRKEQIRVNQAAVNQAHQNLQMSRVRLGYTVLRAPASGVVLVRQAELGEVMAPGTPVVTIADVEHLWMRGYVSETDLGRIHWGQVATVHTDTFPGKTYLGRVSFISSEAEFTPKSVETHKERVTLVYRVKIDLDNPNHELKPGMPADATIDIAAKK
ncbi:MAG: efflux RND transporter periplasmic adaptor subunit [Candidatus Acidiferrales bacterium]|jgi:HlyD family secretion protein